MIHIQKPDGTVLTPMQKWDILNPCPPVEGSHKNYFKYRYSDIISANMASFIPERVTVERKPTECTCGKTTQCICGEQYVDVVTKRESDMETLKSLIENNTLSRFLPEGVCKILSEQFGERKPDTGITINNYDPTLKIRIGKNFLIDVLSNYAQFYHSGMLMEPALWKDRPIISHIKIAEEWIDQNLTGVCNFK